MTLLFQFWLSTCLCAPSVLQKVISIYLGERDFGNHYLAGLRKKLNKSFCLMEKALKELNFTVPEINGGYFIWAKLPENYCDDFKFAIDLYEQEKVAVIPGIHFSDNSTNYIRLNIAREEKEINLAIEKFNRFFKYFFCSFS